MPFIEDYREFSLRQGGKQIAVAGRYLFPNGAQSDGQSHANPPDDPRELPG